MLLKICEIFELTLNKEKKAKQIKKMGKKLERKNIKMIKKIHVKKYYKVENKPEECEEKKVAR